MTSRPTGNRGSALHDNFQQSGSAPMRHDYPEPNGESMVALRYYEPPPEFTDLVGSIYLFTANMSFVSDGTRADFAQLRYMLSGRGHYTFHDGRQMDTPEVCMLGPTMSSIHFDVDGPLQTLGVALLPLGWAALTGRDASDHADSLFDFGAVDAGHLEMLETLRGMEDPDEAVDLLWMFLGGRFQLVAKAMRDFVKAADRWLAEESSPRVEALIEATGLSARQVARLTNRLYGAPPKLLARKYRALKVSSLIATTDEDWRVIIGDAFYDQSHFIRELKYFVGATPHQIKNKLTIVPRLTLSRRRLEGRFPYITRIS